jgi:hypothetical protein
MIVYVDNNIAFKVNANQLSTSLPIASGQHNITVNAWDTSGAVFKTTVFVTVPGGGTGPVSVALMPNAATLAPGVMQQFAATVLNTANTAVIWSVDGFINGNINVGTITTGGLYTAPPTNGTHRVVATSVADLTKSDTAIVTVTSSGGGGGGGTCSPSSGPPSVTICSPASGATVSSPVQISAVGISSTPISKTLVYIDGVLQFQTTSLHSSFSAVLLTLPVGNGPHNLTVQFFNGAWIKGSETFTVGIAPPPVGPLGVCPAPQSPGVNVCLPTNPTVINSPFQVIAAGTGASGKVFLMELWADGSKISEVLGSRFSAPVTLSSGTHQLTAVELDSAGAFVKSAPFDVDVLNMSNDVCSPPGSPGVNVCVPFQGSCHTAGWTTVIAAGTGASGTVSRMELWIDGVKIGDFPGNEIRTNLLVNDFSVMTIVEVDSNGAFIKSVPITVQSC